MASWGNCRYYEGKLPELDQVVMVNIKQVRGADQIIWSFPLLPVFHRNGLQLQG